MRDSDAEVNQWPPEHGALAALPVVRHLKNAVGDRARILQLVAEAERCFTDLQALSEVYGVAVDVYGHGDGDRELRDLGLKRLRALCKTSPSEARDFFYRQCGCSGSFADARLYEACASMEERLGDTAKAVKLLQEGLRVGATPAERLHRELWRLLPSPPLASGIVASADGCVARKAGRTALSPRLEAAQETLRDAVQEVAVRSCEKECDASPIARKLPLGKSATSMPAAVATPNRAPSGHHRSAGTPCGASPSLRDSPWCAKARGARPAPRFLNLGSPMRNLRAEGRDDEVLGDDEDDAGFGGPCVAVPSDHLSTIQEEGSSGGSTHRLKSTPRTAQEASQSPLPRAAAPQETPQKPPACTMVTPGDTGRATKVVYVNGEPYTQLQTIGRGGSSKVYRVQDQDGRILALKRVQAENSKQLEAFQNEVTLLLQLRDHDHVIQVLDAEIEKERGRIQIVMEVGEMDLGRYLRAERLDLAKLRDLWGQMLQAVQVIHDERIVHSDLKPGNFLIVGGQLKVIDFGIAKKISNDTTNISHDTSVGTLTYMAPEAVKQGQLKLSRASDVWSLGIIFYQMVYGHAPFAHLDPMERLLVLTAPQISIAFPQPTVEGLSSASLPALMDVLQGCLRRDPLERHRLSDLLAHPFLRGTVQVRREDVGRLVEMMKTALRTCDVDCSDDVWCVFGEEAWSVLAGDLHSKTAERTKSLEPISDGVHLWAKAVAAGRSSRNEAKVVPSAVPVDHILSETPRTSKSVPSETPRTAKRPAKPEGDVAAAKRWVLEFDTPKARGERTPSSNKENVLVDSERRRCEAPLLEKQRQALRRC